MAIFTFHFYKVFSTTQSLEIHFFLFQTRDFRFLLSRQEVSESGKKQQRLRCTKPRALIGIHGGGYVVGGGGMAAMYSLELDSAAGVTAATAATVFTHYCSSL